MLNQTSAKQVHKIINEFFDRWPTALDLAEADSGEVSQFVRSLGFYNRRAASLIRMSNDYLNGFDDVKELHGVGKYAADSFQIFCRGYLVSDVSDKELRNYVNWAQEEGRRDSRT